MACRRRVCDVYCTVWLRLWRELVLQPVAAVSHARVAGQRPERSPAWALTVQGLPLAVAGPLGDGTDDGEFAPHGGFL